MFDELSTNSCLALARTMLLKVCLVPSNPCYFPLPMLLLWQIPSKSFGLTQVRTMERMASSSELFADGKRAPSVPTPELEASEPVLRKLLDIDAPTPGDTSYGSCVKRSVIFTQRLAPD